MGSAARDILENQRLSDIPFATEKPLLMGLMNFLAKNLFVCWFSQVFGPPNLYRAKLCPKAKSGGKFRWITKFPFCGNELSSCRKENFSLFVWFPRQPTAFGYGKQLKLALFFQGSWLPCRTKKSGACLFTIWHFSSQNKEKFSQKRALHFGILSNVTWTKGWKNH